MTNTSYIATAALLAVLTTAAAAAGPKSDGRGQTAKATPPPFGILCDQWITVPTNAGPGIMTIHPVAIDGRHRVDAVAVVDGKPVARLLWLTADDTPLPPLPPVPPVPPVPPIPPITVQPLAITIIEESSLRTPAQAAILFNDQIADLIIAQKHLCRIVDKDAQFPAGVPDVIKDALARAAKAKLPYLVLWGTAAKTVVSEGPMPEIAADFLALIKQHGGPKP